LNFFYPPNILFPVYYALWERDKIGLLSSGLKDKAERPRDENFGDHTFSVDNPFRDIPFCPGSGARLLSAGLPSGPQPSRDSPSSGCWVFEGLGPTWDSGTIGLFFFPPPPPHPLHLLDFFFFFALGITCSSGGIVCRRTLCSGPPSPRPHWSSPSLPACSFRESTPLGLLPSVVVLQEGYCSLFPHAVSLFSPPTYRSLCILPFQFVLLFLSKLFWIGPLKNPLFGGLSRGGGIGPFSVSEGRVFGVWEVHSLFLVLFQAPRVLFLISYFTQGLSWFFSTRVANLDLPFSSALPHVGRLGVSFSLCCALRTPRLLPRPSFFILSLWGTTLAFLSRSG